MKNELIQALSNITDVNLITDILKNMNSRDICILQALLIYTNDETEIRWLNTYSSLMKY